MADARVGNDVVDLRDPETLPGASHQRFDARVFARGERAAIERAADSQSRRWQLWAAKEAAFKALRRTDPMLAFRPLQFEVTLHAEGKACVRHGLQELHVALEVTPDSVHAVVGSPFRAATARLATDESPRQGVRRLALALARRLFPGEALRIERRDRIPHLVRSSDRIRTSSLVRSPRFTGAPERPREFHVPLSLSHHGRFVACALAEGSA